MCFIETTNMMDSGHMRQPHLQEQETSNNIVADHVQQNNGQLHVTNPSALSDQPVEEIPQTPLSSLLCIRQGCTNPAIINSEWEDEYCSNECCVHHCKDVFNTWVASNQHQIPNNFSTVT
uniref:TOX high mobility group box family member 4 n=1 Tax=Clastoptera arizonana TaxID=38151 RepID=A0A1B6DWA1_9HEMI